MNSLTKDRNHTLASSGILACKDHPEVALLTHSITRKWSNWVHAGKDRQLKDGLAFYVFLETHNNLLG